MLIFLADLVVLIHFAFILFVVAGGFLVLKWPKFAWLHLPAALWGAMIEFSGWICPLTPLENSLRQIDPGSSKGFIETYISALIYPEALTRGVQLFLGLMVIAVNVSIYWYVLRQRKYIPTDNHQGKTSDDHQLL